MLVGLRARLAKIPILNGPPAADPAGWPAPSVAGRSDQGPHLVFFQHDEVIVHCPADQADAVVAAVTEAGAAAGRLVFGPTRVAFPLTTAVVDCYADAK